MPGKGFVRAVVVRRLHHPALPGRGRLDPARGAECRLAQQGLDGAHRRRAPGRSTSTLRAGLVAGHRRCTSFPYVFVFTTTALDLVSSEMEDAANILGAGRAAPRFKITLPLVLPAILGGAIIVVPRGHRAVRRARPDRPAGALPRGDDRSSGSSSSSRPGRRRLPPMRCRCCCITMPAVLAAAAGSRRARATPRSRGKGGERRLIRLGAWRWVMLGYALFVCALAVLLPMRRARAGRFREGLGTRLLPRQPHACATSTTCCSSTSDRNRRSSTPSCMRARRLPSSVALALAIAYVVSRRLVPFERRPDLPVHGAVRHSRASCSPSASMPRMHRRRLRSTAPPRS